ATADVLVVLQSQHQQRAEAASGLHPLECVVQPLQQITTVTQGRQTVDQVVLLQLGIVAGQQLVLIQQAVDQLGNAIGSIDAWQQLLAHGGFADEVVHATVK